MTRTDAQALLAALRTETEAMCGLLEELVRAESPSLDPSAQRRVFETLARELEALGFLVRRIRGDGVGDHFFARPATRSGRRFQLLVGHLDTVWPLGTVARMPVRREGGALFGPGAFDMKGGLVQLVFALRALVEHGAAPALVPVVFVAADEEIGSRDSKRHLCRIARSATRAFVLEPAFGRAGDLKTQRKGLGRFTVAVRGRAAHAGIEPEAGVSAILELAGLVQRLFALNDPSRGVTVNVGMIDGGLRPNVVAPTATAVVEARAWTAADAAGVEAAIRGLRPEREGIRVVIEGGFGRPPLEPTERNRALWRLAADAARELGIPLGRTSVGGASDGNYTSVHTATLDGLGAVGGGAHAEDEHVIIERMPERAALLALLIAAPETPASGEQQVLEAAR